jgi:co-chaperonin GroES (HSP10)
MDSGAAEVSAFAELMKDGAKIVAFERGVNRSGILPTEYKVLVLPDPVEEVTKGGIIIPIEKAEKDKYATTDGTIVAISHLAFTYATDEEWAGKKPKAGDRVAFAKYAGARRKGKDGSDYLLINDKDVVAIIEE